MTKSEEEKVLKSMPIIIQIASVVVIILGAWFTLPQQIMAQVDCTYVRKDVHAVQQQNIEEKLNKIESMIKAIAYQKGGNSR